MDFLKKNMVPILGGVALLLAGYVYFTYFAGKASSPTLSSSDTNKTLSQDLLVTLQNLHTIQLDNTIFSDPAFQSLTSFGVTIPPENVGRRNPFLPISVPVVSGSPTIKLPPLPQ